MSNRFQNIDALRAIAALTVLVQHQFGNIWRAIPQDADWLRYAFAEYFDAGRFGVTLFFLISGYVIPLSVSGPRPREKFVISRIFRLYPAFWLSVVLMTMALVASGETVSPAQFLANLTMAYPAFGQPALSGIYWTLIVEMAFYVLCFGLFTLGWLNSAKVTAAVAVLGVCSAVVPIIAGKALGHDLPAPMHGLHLSFLFLGSLYRQSREGSTLAKRLAPLVLAVSVVGVIVATGALGTENKFSIGMTLGAVLAVLVAPVVFQLSWKEKLKNPPSILLMLGAWSYSIYLFHEPISHTYLHVFGVKSPTDAVLYILATTSCSIILAGVVYTAVEKPAINLGRIFAGRIRGNTVSEAI